MRFEVDPDDGRTESMIHQTELRDHLASKSVAILGCGGLGSNCAAMLVRTGVLHLTLVDFDTVEAENLNRQEYFLDQIGLPKVEALAATLWRIDEAVDVRTIDGCIDADGLLSMVAGADVIVEAVDVAETKAMIMQVCSRELPDIPLVAASGLAGYASANQIETIHLADKVWVAGDLLSDIRDGHALVASRVMTTAAHQANAVIRILLGLDVV